MNKNQLSLGVLIIAVSLIVLLSNTNFMFARELVTSWWPLLIVLLGLYVLWTDRRNLAGGLILTGVGVGLLVNTLGVFGLSFADVVVPIVLFAIGVALVAGAFRAPELSTDNSSRSSETVSAVLGSVTSRNNANDYRGGNINAVLGGAEVDLSKATIKKEAVVQVWVLMGGITLRVPEGVTIKQRTLNILGGTEDKTINHSNDKAPVLYIDGTVTLGGIEVKH